MRIENVVIKRGGQSWKIREAVSMRAAEDCIAMARVRGCVGASECANGEVQASVVRANSDGTEKQPYSGEH